MGVEFRLGHQEGHKVEDFLPRQPKGVSAITLSTSCLRHQVAAAEAAIALEADVLLEPPSERLVAPGFELRDFDYGLSGLLNTAELSRDANARTQLVRDLVAAHPDTATLVTPPHFYVEDDHGSELNIALVEEMLQTSKREMRPVLLINRVYAEKHAAALAASYASAGISRPELRLTPVGGDDESLPRIQSVFAIYAAFTQAGIEVTLGASGNIGHAAVALGHVTHYSVGVGLLESVDYKATSNRQSAPPKPVEDKRNRGVIAGIYLPGLMLIVGRQHGGPARQHRHPHQDRLPPRLLRDLHQRSRERAAAHTDTDGRTRSCTSSCH